ncbi:related to synaptic vesicle transporter SV2 (major facilitator superfamily) [Fusarium fujikuroi IMI 58289]|uniref:Related to synaptic vesicle transporter SV2 (Major facilitator superfamily) n=1 Tax=Gibberella fujikuroi (strain CBS 195.34 / IMI 58289 / NRRL A-6831) TaxID=1279085 RepID=S0DZY2_GIBF5|nr:related to synaptic vesicle transporter SV2 (major facilitator superfamily) [Fusarium fujikuroi IMI 58289]KLP03543.1 synaptic vesicle transporter SV2 (major facilitator superfamily) [Fusarium fujikuroi]KLP13104.1 synaptic vesicle transporter SV2 (major facilitator superfamily) [Fusarium fujikuroi]CCT67960.1 related to synaptic vesicle transporter SV2 (major facilitator superfamily) [Fusarium fujikuroi IMI 58289]
MSDKSTTDGPVTMPQPSDKLSDRERYADLRTSGDRHGESLSFQMGTEDEQIFSLRDIDPVLDAKMRLINKTMDEIGWTNMHLKLFFLNGFGYAADSLILALQAVTAGQAALEFRPAFSYGLNVAVYTGMLVGVLFWGLGADVIGRRYAFNISLFLSSVFAIAAGASPNWIVLATFVGLAAFGAGGNLVLDTTVFLEFLPGNKQWLVTLMACWWGLAYVIVAAFCWPIYSNPKYTCADADTCTKGNNMGWRYVWYGNGALVFVCSILRVTVIRLKETPKYLLAKGDDVAVVAIYQDIAKKYQRTCSLTIDALESMGAINSTYGKSRYSLSELWAHFHGLFVTRKLAISTILIWISWLLIGLAYPLFYVFLPDYLASRGAKTGESGPYYQWRNYMLSSVTGIFGPVAAAFMCNTKLLGRKYTMAIGALITMAFFFAYTAVKTPAQNVALSCVIAFTLNIYYGTLYAYTPEVLPSAHRATGNGIAVAGNRIMGLVSSFVAAYGNTATSVPIYVCAVLYIVMVSYTPGDIPEEWRLIDMYQAIIAVILPFEPYGKRSM